MRWWQRPEVPDRLNICVVAERFPILGRATEQGFLWPLARELALRGHRVTVLAWKNAQGKAQVDADGVTAYFLGEPYGLNRAEFPTLALAKFSELHRQTPFDLVHSLDASGFQIGLKKKNFKVAVIFDVAATHLGEIFSILAFAQETVASVLRTTVQLVSRFLYTYFAFDRRLLHTADGVFVTSPIQKIFLERYYLYPDYRTYLVPYGMAIGDLSPRAKSAELCQKLGLTAQMNVAVCVSDMTELGEIRNLLRAFERVAIKKPGARLIVVGHGPLRKEIEFEVYSLALGNRVLFAGDLKAAELSDYIALADVLVNISSRTSGFEPSLIEAMAQKKVIIGSEVSPIATVVEDGEDGFLIRPADISALTHLLFQIFNGQIPVEQIGEKARMKILNLFDIRKMVDVMVEAFYQTLKKTRYAARKTKR